MSNEHSHRLVIGFNPDDLSEVSVGKYGHKHEQPTTLEEVAKNVSEDLTVAIMGVAAIIRGADDMGIGDASELMKLAVDSLGKLVYDSTSEGEITLVDDTENLDVEP